MKNFITFILSSLIIVSCGAPKSVSYTHKPSAPEGCNVSYSVVQQDKQPAIVVTVRSDRLIFGENPLMQLKNSRGKVLKLEGTNLQSRTKNGGVVVGSVVVPTSELYALAQFPVDTANIAFFEPGIVKVRLSTVPITHERTLKTFERDQMGRYLYKALLKVQKTSDEF